MQGTRAKMEAAHALDNLDYDIQWVHFAGAAPLLEALNADAVDTAPAGDLPIILAAAAGVPMKLVAASRSTGEGTAILVPGTSPIRTVADLRGQQVIVSSARGSVAHYLLLAALEDAGIPEKEVGIGFMLPNDAAAAFAAGRLAAWATFGVYQATAHTRGARVILDGRGINSGIALVVASPHALADGGKRAAITDYLGRLRRAHQWNIANPEAYAQVYARRTGVPIGIARVLAQWQNSPLMPVDGAIVSALQQVADRFHAWHGLPRHVDIAPLVEPDIFPRS